MHRNHNDFRRDVQELAYRILTVHRDMAGALKTLREGQPGFPTSSMGGGGHGQLSDDGTPAGLLRFVMRQDPASRDLADLDEHLLKAKASMVEVYRIVETWSRPPSKAGLNGPRSGGDCLACDRYCSGSATDRLRAGFCPACHASWQRWRRSEGGSRHDWLTIRRRAIAEANARSEAS